MSITPGQLNPRRCLQAPTGHGIASAEKAQLMDVIVPELRLDMLRQEYKMSTFWPSSPTSANTAPFDDTMSRLHAGGCAPLVQVRAFPDWSNGNAGDETVAPLDLNVFGDYCEALAVRYGPAGVYPTSRGWGALETAGVAWHFEILNEPDLASAFHSPSSLTYTRMLRIARDRIKAVDPRIVIVGVCASIFGGIEGIGLAPGGQYWAAALYAQGAGPYFDVLSHHIYPGSSGPLSNFTVGRLRNMRRVMANYGDGSKPVWLTEFGWTVPGDATEQQQANYVPQAYNRLIPEYGDLVTSLFLSKAIDDAAGSFPAGLVKNDPPTWTRKLAYDAYRYGI